MCGQGDDRSWPGVCVTEDKARGWGCRWPGSWCSVCVPWAPSLPRVDGGSTRSIRDFNTHWVHLKNAGLRTELLRPRTHWTRRRPVGSLHSWMLPRLVRPVLWALTNRDCNSSPGDIRTISEIDTNLRELCDVVSCLIKRYATSNIPWTFE